MLSAEGSVGFKQAVSRSPGSVSVDRSLEGYTGTSPSGPGDVYRVLEALTWFKASEQGVHAEALWMHYSALDPSRPRTIDIAPSVSRMYQRPAKSARMEGSRSEER